MGNYLQLIEKISKSSGLSTEEIERKIEAKRAKLSGLVSKEGAAQIVAAELGIHFDKERMKLSELLHGMKRANVIGKVIDISPVRAYTKNGREGKVASLTLADESTNARLVLWDTNHIALIENNAIKRDDIIEVSNANVRNGELHLSSFGDIKHSNEKIENVVSKKAFSAGDLGAVKAGQSLSVRAFIIQVFEPRFFEVCPECGKKSIDNECKVHGKIEPKRRALLNIIVDDGHGSLRSVLFGEQIYKLGLDEDSVFSLDKFNERKKEILGEEKIFLGTVRANTLYNTPEFNIEQVEEVSTEELLKELEAKT